jgi:hypothetical protein
VTITLDYRYDDDLINGNQFFSTSNPQGASGAATARAAMQAAADYYSGILTDTLLPIESPRYEAANGTVLWRWTARFTNPSTGFGLELANDPPPAEPPLPIAANEYVIFVGARPLANNAVGTASPGVVKKVQWFLNGSLTAAEKNIRDTINDQFIARAERRGETSGFVSWGGSVAFDSDASNQWHFDHLSSPSGNEVDL